MQVTAAQRRELAATLPSCSRGDVVATGHGFVVEAVHYGDAHLVVAVGPQGRVRVVNNQLTIDGEAKFADHTQSYSADN